MTDVERRLARLEAYTELAEKQNNKMDDDIQKLSAAVGTMNTTLQAVSTKLETLPLMQKRINEEHERTVVDDALAQHRQRSKASTRNFITTAIALSSFMAAFVFGVLELLKDWRG